MRPRRATTPRCPTITRRRAGAGHRRVEHLAAQEERARGRVGDRRSPPAARCPGPCGSSTRRRAAAAAPPPPAAAITALGARTSRPRRPRGASSRRRIVPFISPSSCRLRPEASACRRSAAGRRAPAAPRRVERLAQPGVERVDAQRALVHRREHLDVGERVDPVVGGQPLARPARRPRRAPRAGRRARSGTGRGSGPSPASNDGGSPCAHRVGAAHDHAPGGLAEDVRELGDRHRPRLHQLGERLAGADRRELVGVADEHDVRARPDRAAAASPAARGWPSRSRRRSAGRPRARRPSAPGRAPSRARSGSWRRRARSTRPSAARRGRSARRARPTRPARAAAAQISRIVAVLPVPGPPVTIDSREPNAARTAAHCSGAGTRSSSGGARGRREPRLRRRASARTLLRQLRLERRGLRAVRPDRSVAIDFEHQLAGVRPSRAAAPPAAARRAARRRVAASSRHRQARRAVPLRLGEHVHHAGARARAGESAATPPARAIVSAIWKPTPNTLVSSYGRPRTTCVRAGRRTPSSMPRHEPGEPVRREQQVQRAGGAQRVPRPDRLVRAPRVEPHRTERGARVAVDRVQHVVAVARRAAAPRAPRPTCLTRRRYAVSAARRTARAARRSPP